MEIATPRTVASTATSSTMGGYSSSVDSAMSWGQGQPLSMGAAGGAGGSSSDRGSGSPGSAAFSFFSSPFSVTVTPPGSPEPEEFLKPLPPSRSPSRSSSVTLGDDYQADGATLAGLATLPGLTALSGLSATASKWSPSSKVPSAVDEVDSDGTPKEGFSQLARSGSDLLPSELLKMLSI